jgi:hypothetical protein
MFGVTMTDWELSKISTIPISTTYAVAPAMKFDVGVAPLEFYNRSTGAVEKFNAVFLGIGHWAPGFFFFSAYLPKRSSRVFASSTPFSIGSIRGNYGVIFTTSSWVMSGASICFSRHPLGPLFPFGIFAGCTFTAPPSLYGRLTAGVLGFRVD